MPAAVKNDSEKSSPLLQGGGQEGVEEGIISLCVLTQRTQRTQRRLSEVFLLLFLFSFYPPLCL